MCAPCKNSARSDEDGCEPKNGMVRLLDSKHSFFPVIAKPSSRDQVYAQTDDHSNNLYGSTQLLRKNLGNFLWRRNNELRSSNNCDHY